MLEKLPLEVLLKIVYDLDDTIKRKRPLYTFYYTTKQLRSLSQVNHYLQQALGTLLYRHASLLRQKENDGPKAYDNDRAVIRLDQLRHLQRFIHELEIPTSLPLSKVSQNFNNIKSLTVLGDNNIQFDTEIQLEHIALVLPKQRFKIQGLRRLDLLIDPRLIQSMNALDSFQNNPIEELNITVRNLTTIQRHRPFLKFLSSLKSTLRKFSIRCSTQPQPSSLILSDILPSTLNFFQIINSFALTHLSIDFLLFKMHSFGVSSQSTQSTIPCTKPLVVEILEPSLAGPLTTQQNQIILEFLSQLSSYTIKTLNLIFGIQTELPYNTALHVLQNLAFDIHYGSDELEHLRSIRKVGALMAWHIIDDSVYMDCGIQRRLLSYESDETFTPGYRKLELYDVIVSENSLYLLREKQDDAFDFWSRECQRTSLLKYSSDKRSSLWY